MFRILIVDDDDFVRRVVREKMKNHSNIHFIDAVSGNQAITLLQSGEVFDFIISDYNMRDGSGADLLSFIYESKMEIPFVLFTNAIDPEIQETDAYFMGIVEKMNIPGLKDLIGLQLTHDFKSVVDLN